MRLPVLMYHAVHPEPSLISIKPEEFAWQMRWLHRGGYRVISLGDLAAILEKENDVPTSTVVLTFDDGVEALFSFAFPILAEYGFSATIFLVAGYCGGWNNWPSQPTGVPGMRLLNWEQIQEMDRNRIEFGAHTMTHPRLDRVSLAEANSEIQDSKARIEERLSHSVNTFAYPYGRYTPQIRDLVSRSFTGACTTLMGYVDSHTDRYEMQRIDINYIKSPLLFRQLFSITSPPYLAARRMVRAVANRLLNRQWY